MNRIKTTKQIIQAAKIGEYLFCESFAGNSINGWTMRVTERCSRRGRGGGVTIYVVDAAGNDRYFRSVSCVLEHVRVATRDERLHFMATERARLLNEELERQKRASPPRQTYASPVERIRITADAMEFLRHADLREFPCTPELLRSARQRVVFALHPDRGGNAEKFVAAMRAYDELNKQCH
jgi:hypothetical protein